MVMFTISMGIALVYSLYRRRKNLSKSETLCLIAIILATVLSIAEIWYIVAGRISIFFQFPNRYVPYTILLLLIIAFRHTDLKSWLKKGILLVSIINTICLMFITGNCSTERNASASFTYVGNGEFLDTTFKGIYVADKDEDKQMLILNKDKLSARSEEDETILYETKRTEDNSIVTAVGDFKAGQRIIFPKIWYIGYTSDNGVVEKGIGQMCVVTVENDCNEISLWFVEPIWLRILNVFCWIDVIGLIGIQIMNKRRGCH